MRPSIKIVVVWPARVLTITKASSTFNKRTEEQLNDDLGNADEVDTKGAGEASSCRSLEVSKSQTKRVYFRI